MENNNASVANLRFVAPVRFWKGKPNMVMLRRNWNQEMIPDGYAAFLLKYDRDSQGEKSVWEAKDITSLTGKELELYQEMVSFVAKQLENRRRREVEEKAIAQAQEAMRRRIESVHHNG